MGWSIAMPEPELGNAAQQLPLLSRMLVAARRLPRAADWRSGVLTGLQGEVAADVVPPAAVAARALPALAGAALCFATPLHVVAGISRVHLPPDGMLAIDAAERTTWLDAFNADFGGEGLRLHAAGSGWLLQAPFAAAARDASPENHRGFALSREPAAGEAERALRRLGAEVEMWLAAHALNREREARHLPAFNCLWFWGGAHAVELPALARRPTRVVSNAPADAWLAGLASHLAQPVGMSGIDWTAPDIAAEGLAVLGAGVAGPGRQDWEAIEAQWLAPAWQALRAGRIESLRLQVGRSAWRLPDRSPLRWLRRARGWQELVGA